ncbi:MAG: hypothetical protein MUC91_07595 [Verrucomicrobia bacterium]|jgi:hypothetical protein|nr:hypothetical protein [Verrucomicrobiota bacterium]
MSTVKQRKAALRNLERARKVWTSMPSHARSRAQPEGRARAKPGAPGKGGFYHVAVRRKSEFRTFRTHDLGKPGGIERVAGRRSSGSWDTQKWLISKKLAHVRNGRLVADSAEADKLLDSLGSKPRHASGDRFTAKPRPNAPEKGKPTPAQKRARSKNIKKAQAAKRKK